MKPDSEDWQPGPVEISSLTRITPKLMRLTWQGCPLHHDPQYGWGYLEPIQPGSGRSIEEELDRQDPEGDMSDSRFPVK